MKVNVHSQTIGSDMKKLAVQYNLYWHSPTRIDNIFFIHKPENTIAVFLRACARCCHLNGNVDPFSRNIAAIHL
jgi:hypothetical protein